MDVATDVDKFFDNLVLISNSVPKSGSTFLFSMQRDFLLSVAGRPASDHALFTDNGVQLSNGFVVKPLAGPFLDVLEKTEICGGPHVLKTHMPVTPRLREILHKKPNLFMSLAIRDPVEIFLSARDNLEKTGEFPEFADVETGCALVQGHFTNILRSSREAGHHKILPVVRYEEIVGDPLRALVSSLHPEVIRNIIMKVVRQYTNMDKSRSFAANRLNIGKISRLDSESDTVLLAILTQHLAAARAEFGYG